MRLRYGTYTLIDSSGNDNPRSMEKKLARPREFDEDTVLDAAVDCFWSRGYEATTVRDLMGRTGLTGASLYNAFGDKRAVFGTALAHFVAQTIEERITRCDAMPPREAISTFFQEVLARSLTDTGHKGCMLVNSALEVAPHDAGIQRYVATVLHEIEAFFLRSVRAGQESGSIGARMPAEQLASHLLGVLMGLRVLSRVRPEPMLLKGVLEPAMALLDP